jgi:2-polyprenyl-3-methyl-5-hydroxy-6-metoxy-1,4-benzoquinol methylase
MIGNDIAKQIYISKRIQHWDNIAKKKESEWSKYYHKYLERVYKFYVPSKQRILEIGCSKGDLLAALKPSEGIGIDQSNEMIQLARQRYPDLQFIQGLIEDIKFEGTFDVIILSDVLNEVWNVQELFAHLSNYCNSSTRIIINAYSRLWQPILSMARKLGLVKPMLPQNWLTVKDIDNLLHLGGFETIKTSSEIIFPLNIPVLSLMANRYLAKIYPFRLFCMSNFIIARKAPEIGTHDRKYLVSVIVAARNEKGNIASLFKRIPEIGAGTEIIFVEGGSSDNTFETIRSEIEKNPHRRAYVHRQTGKGKGDAVRLGFNKANGDILMILDADMTVSPEDLPMFYNALVSGKGEFINGVRLVYPMESEAMRFWNLVGNKFFSLAFTWLLDQPIKDTLCGTKVLTKENYEKIAANRSYFGEFDPFGDFDLIFGAAKLNLKIVDMPIRYRDRQYGTTNISRWRHGMILLRMAVFAASRIKFF